MNKDFPLFLSLMRWTLHRVLISADLYGGFQDVEGVCCILGHVLLTGKVTILSPAFLHSLQWIKYWELDYACCLCWPYFSSSMASPTLGSADLWRKTPFFNWERHINNYNQVNCLLSYANNIKAISVAFHGCFFVFLDKDENLICICKFLRSYCDWLFVCMGTVKIVA